MEEKKGRLPGNTRGAKRGVKGGWFVGGEWFPPGPCLVGVGPMLPYTAVRLGRLLWLRYNCKENAVARRNSCTQEKGCALAGVCFMRNHVVDRGSMVCQSYISVCI